jgi:uncharacterized delta-60 repeat protein
MIKKINLALIFLFVTTTTFAQRAGSLDTTFNHTGIVYDSLANDSGNVAYAMAIQNDGKIVVAGYVNKTSSSFKNCVVIRYNTDGSLDTSFNKTGYIILALDTVYGSFLNAVSIQTNGKIVALGEGTNGFALIRLNINGTLDNTFGIKGIDTTSITGYATSLALQFNGYIVVGDTRKNFELIRFDTTGKLDNTFGVGGIASTNFNVVYVNDVSLNAIAIQNDGKIVAAGYYIPNGGQRLALARYNTDGSLDNTFGTNGIDTANYNNYEFSVATGVVVQNDSKIAICGVLAKNDDLTSDTFSVIRYNSNGSFDTSFGKNGIASSTINGTANSILLQPDNKIIACGYEVNIGFALLRLNTNGTADTSFGNDGVVTTAITSNLFSAQANSVALQPNGKIVAAGFGYLYPYYYSYIDLARYNNDISAGILNLSSTPTSLLIYPNPVHDIETLDYTLTNDEILSIYLYDMTGKMVKNYMNNEKELTGEYKQQLNFENLPAGTYILTISNADSKTESVKIVKQ